MSTAKDYSTFCSKKIMEKIDEILLLEDVQCDFNFMANASVLEEVIELYIHRYVEQLKLNQINSGQ